MFYRKQIQILITVPYVLRRISWTTLSEFFPASECDPDPSSSSQSGVWNRIGVWNRVVVWGRVGFCGCFHVSSYSLHILWGPVLLFQNLYLVLLLALTNPFPQVLFAFCFCVCADMSSIKCAWIRGWTNTVPVPCVNSTSSKPSASWYVYKTTVEFKASILQVCLRGAEHLFQHLHNVYITEMSSLCWRRRQMHVMSLQEVNH